MIKRSQFLPSGTSVKKTISDRCGLVGLSPKEKLFSELLKKRHITIAENNRVHYPE